MHKFHNMTKAIIALVAVGAANTAHAGAEVSLRADLERIAERRILFGHQSVGVNLLDGVKQLAANDKVTIRLFETPTTGGGAGGIWHTFVAKNGDPFLKLKSFEQAMEQHSAGLDIAMVKFCYADINGGTDVIGLFARYQSTLDSLKIKYPGTTFVHVTVPLTTMQGGIKGAVKKLIGRAPYGAAENIRRAEYNDLMRQAYEGREPIFDLARVESTSPDGTAVIGEWQGKFAPAMAPAYTDDGGHLNTTGRIRAAREFVSVLASIPNRAAAKDRSPR